MARHLESQEDFVNSFAEFQRLLNNKVIFEDEENVCRLFDMWLVNYKDERMIEEQLKKDPWEQDPDF
ncbi:MAG: hypothetical protein ACXABY_29890 [Candidatus Thorarchaeota archaeon]|jgi:hypothetical protein